MIGLLCFYLVHFKFDVQYQWNIRINYIGPFLSKQRINKGRTVRTRIFCSSNKYILLSEQRYFVISTRILCLRTKILCRIPTKILCYRNKDTLLSKLGYLAFRTKILCCHNKVMFFVIRTRIQYFAIRTRLPCYPNKDTFNYFVIQTRQRCFPNKDILFFEQR